MADLLVHAWVADTHGRDACDHKGDDDGQRRTCGRPAREHLDQQPIGSRPVELQAGTTVVRAGPYVEVVQGILTLDLLIPEHAKAIARALLLAAHQAERGPRHG